ncbi:MAG: rRNA maturation RNase YbeY [Treponema sp.]|nr:rRNA maturation RNase YbeY [Treponema sp.]
MNRVDIRAEEVPIPHWKGAAGNYIKSILNNLGHKDWTVSVLLCNNKYIKTLNSEYRNKNEPTDVLSFPLGEKGPGGAYLAGDIVLSLDALNENVNFFKVPLDEELRRLLVHGILHLSGYDHETNESGEPMLIKQEEILLGITERII